MKRMFDVMASAAVIIILIPVFLVCALIVKFASKGPIFYLSDRVGTNNKHFNMIKFRTMRDNTPQMATHLMVNPSDYLIPAGEFLRKTSLDELPQLINVINGDMSLVGPRPALFNQKDQIELRNKSGCHVLTPGITGWAQIHGRDDMSIAKKVEYDTWYFHNRTFWLDLKILWLTVWNVIARKGVTH